MKLTQTMLLIPYLNQAVAQKVQCTVTENENFEAMRPQIVKEVQALPGDEAQFEANGSKECAAVFGLSFDNEDGELTTAIKNDKTKYCTDSECEKHRLYVEVIHTYLSDATCIPDSHNEETQQDLANTFICDVKTLDEGTTLNLDSASVSVNVNPMLMTISFLILAIAMC